MAPQVVGGSSADDASRPGARFAALKAAEAKKGGKQKRQAQGNVPKSVNWVDSSGENKE